MYIIFFKKNWGVTCVTCYIYKTLIWETHVTWGVTCGVTCITCQDISSCSWWQFKFCLYYWFCTMCLLCLRFFWVGNDFCTRDFLRERERKIERQREKERERQREAEREISSAAGRTENDLICRNVWNGCIHSQWWSGKPFSVRPAANNDLICRNA